MHAPNRYTWKTIDKQRNFDIYKYNCNNAALLGA